MKMVDERCRTKANRGVFNITVVMSPLPIHNNVGAILLEKLLDILLNEGVENVCLISGNIPKGFSRKKLKVIKNADYDTQKCNLVVKMVKYFMMQIKFSYAIFKNRSGIDLVFFWISSALVLPMLTAKLLRKKTLVMATGYVSTAYKNLKFMESINYYLSDTIGVESQSVVEHMHLQKYEKKIVIFHLHVDDKFTVLKKLEDRGNLVGYISRLSREKGILEFLKASELLIDNSSDLKFFIGSSGPLKATVEEKVKEMDNNRILFMDWIPSKKFIEVLNSLKLLVLPSYTEGLPNIILEAMACGTPVLATPVGGIPDVIKDGETGFLMENNSPECIAENVMRALKYQNINEIVTKARKLIEEEYTYEATVEGYSEILYEIEKES